MKRRTVIRNTVFALAFVAAGCAGYFGLLTQDQRREYLAEHHPDWLAAAEEPCEQIGLVWRKSRTTVSWGWFRALPGQQPQKFMTWCDPSGDRSYGEAFLKGRIKVGMTKEDVDALWGPGGFQRANRGASAYRYVPANPWAPSTVVFFDTDEKVIDWLAGD